MKELVVIASRYAPNTAETNRLLSFVSAFDELGIRTKLYFILPDIQRSQLECKWQNVCIEYLWKNSPHNKLVAFIKSFIDILTVRKKLSNKCVFLYGAPQYLTILSKNKSIKLYHERTEHPEVVPWPRFVTRKAYYNACRQIAGLFVISTALKKHFCEKGCSKQKVHIINMIVDPSRFSSLSKSKVNSKQIVYCGKASNNKDGVDELIKSFSIVLKSHPDYKLLIIGETPSKIDMSGNLQLIEKLGIKENILFAGIVPASEMPQMLKDADILALDRPDSIQAQCGFPTKLGEYLLTGNPVVITRVGDIPLFLKDRESVLLAEERNVNDFASKLIWAIENPKGAKQIGEAGLVVAKRHFNSKTEAAKMLNIMNLL